MFLYQKRHTYFAQMADGFDALAQAELQALGATQVEPAYRGIYFQADPKTLYGINYQSRLVSRILAPLVSFPCKDRTELYRRTKTVDWSTLLAVDESFGIVSNVSGNDQLRHSKFAAQCMKDAIVDQFRDNMGKRPSVDRAQPDVWLHLLVRKQRATISLDTSGGSLHKRGYRKDQVAAPMIETLAAAMVTLSEWQCDRPLYDPMCGSGTLLCEAYNLAARIPAAYLRPSFGFQRLPDYDKALWRRVKDQADNRIRTIQSGLVAGSDIDPQAVKAARTNCSQLPDGRTISVAHADFKNIDALENQIIVCNPPYGIRMNQPDELGPFYKSLGDFLKRQCKGSRAYIYFGNRDMIKKIGLKPSWKKPIPNAGLDGRVVKYEMY